MRCSTYHNNNTSSRCTNDATVWMYAPDGKKVPGCWHCKSCARKVIDEYKEKLHEHWFALPIDEYGNATSSMPVIGQNVGTLSNEPTY